MLYLIESNLTSQQVSLTISCTVGYGYWRRKPILKLFLTNYMHCILNV